MCISEPPQSEPTAAAGRPPAEPPFRALLRLVMIGLRLSLTMRSPPAGVVAGPGKVLALLVLLAAAAAGLDSLLAPSPRELNLWSVALEAARAFGLLLSLYLVAAVLRGPPGALERLLALALAALLLPALAARAWVAGYPPDGALPDSLVRWLPSAWLAWTALVLIRSTLVTIPARGVARAGVILFLAGSLAVIVDAVPGWPLWVPSDPIDAEAAAVAPTPPEVDVERIYYSQPRRLDDALAGLSPERAGVTDLYFVGFAADAGQDVFMREVGHLRSFVDRRLGSAGRSLLLVNNPDTVETVPIASVHNLERALGAVGRIMDPAEDLLFVYLTSHGFEDGRLSVEFGDLALANLTPERLGGILRGSGARWRIVAISACYSGAFIDALAGPTTLVMTAARADRASFGCSNDRDFTYFGEALRTALSERASLLDAFPRLQAVIEARERREGRTPSLPQMHVGAAIAHKLRALAAASRSD